MFENKNNKFVFNEKKNFDLLFVLLVIFFIFCISIFNYIVDPYGVLKNRSDFRISFVNGEMVNIYMKAFKNEKMEKIVLGSSDISLASLSFPEFYSITLRGIDYATYYQLLKTHFDLHPETKYVYLSLTYTDITGEYDQFIPPYTGKYYNIKELIRLFISVDTTKLSINKLKNELQSKDARNSGQTYCYPKQVDFIKPLSEKTFIEESERYEYLEKIIQFLKEKEVEYIFVFPPYNAAYLSFIKDVPYYDQQVKRLKKFLVENNIEIYDFAYVNEETGKSLYEIPYLYHNLNHPSFLFGKKIYNDLFYDKKDNQKIYMILNKKNVDEVILYQDKLIENWKINNFEIAELYKEIYFNPKDEYINHKITYTRSDIPQKYLYWWK